MPRTSTRPGRIERKTITGVEARLSLYADGAHPSYDQRMEIEYDGRNWAFGIDSADTVSPMSTAAGQTEFPDRIAQSFRSMGLEGDE